MADKKEVSLDQKETPKQQFAIQRLYVKEHNCKINNAPQIFTQKWQPKIDMEAQVKINPFPEDLYEVVLQLNVTAKNENITAFTAEVQQAGIFVAKGLTAQQCNQLLMTQGPNILFPYVRKLIADMSVDATLPPIILAPIDFTVVYQQQVAAEHKNQDALDKTKGPDTVQ